MAVFFDLDETLADNTRPVGLLFNSVFAELQPAAMVSGRIAEPVAEILREEVFTLWDNMFGQRGDALEQVFASTLSRCGLDAGAAVAMSRLLHEQVAASVQPRPGALQTLRHLREAGIATGIITNGLHALQLAKAEQLGLDKSVDLFIASQQAGAHKPAASVFEYALQNLRVAPSQAWHVGDHPRNDVSGAIACGMHGILYQPADAGANRFDLHEQELARPDAKIAHLEELLLLLDA